ncbi:hypothetical protein SLEP1_g40168 [Rubroshorea leprosula]|uniref:Uncharacterized protein n=1 Tax=Rubroshorea leprosula TaxID=152421 RepID=A0AAV5L2L1_9ROSI|nr:hypothetical protein SLEP1_g40168 [Rubroshorea leprosula]
MADLSGTGVLSFHCHEREVFAALLNQPHAVPSTPRARGPTAFAEVSWLTRGLKRAGQKLATSGQTRQVKSTFHYLMPPLGS